MEFKITMKSGERGEADVTLTINAKDMLDATKWGEIQIKAWGWTNGAVVRADPVDLATKEAAQ